MNKMSKHSLQKPFAVLLTVVLMLSILMIPLAPVKAWESSDPTMSSDTKFEMFGPRVDKLLIKLYSTADAELAALESGEIDIADAWLTPLQILKYTSPPWNDTINVVAVNATHKQAMSRRYVGSTPAEANYTGQFWDGVVNSANPLDLGIDNFWSFLNMHPRNGTEDGTLANSIIRYGVPALNRTLNPLNIDIGHCGDCYCIPDTGTCRCCRFHWLIYDSLLEQSPYNMTEFRSSIGINVEQQTYVHPVYGTSTKIRFTLRSEASWSDGTPVTVADVFFTFVETPRILAARGLPPPEWYYDVGNILDFKLLDPYNFEVLLNGTDASALAKIGRIVILPQHVWRPIVSAGDPYTFAPDPNMIGSGPFRLSEYVPGSHLLLVANTPDRTVQTNIDGSVPITSPTGYFRYVPLFRTILVDPSGRVKIAPDTIDTANVTWDNLDLINSLTVRNWTVKYTDRNGIKTIYNYTNVLIPAGGSFLIRLPITPSGRVAIGKSDVEGCCFWPPGGQNCCGGGIGVCCFSSMEGIRVYVTMDGDISGSTLYDDVDLPEYPYKSTLPSPDIKVNIIDISEAARAFGATPGSSRWGKGIADVKDDYMINILDIAAIARRFGWVG